MLRRNKSRDKGGVMAARGWIGLVVLFGVYALNYLDRTLIYILFRPIKAELDLGDFELALLGSSAFGNSSCCSESVAD